MRLIGRTVVAGVAATRLVRAWKYEKIGEAPRWKLLRWLNTPSFTGNAVNFRRTQAKDWAAVLVDCPHCASVWLSIGCAVGLRVRWLRPVIEGLAGAMVASVAIQWMPGFDFEEPDPPDPLHVVVSDED